MNARLDRLAARHGLSVFGSALALLVLNDLWLKGSGLAPGVVTGKLSDVAGLLVAPLVLAWLLGLNRHGQTSARRARSWLAVHVAVGLGFAALQTPLGADALAVLLRPLGLVSRAWPDPTDLFALPALVLSHRLIRPELITATRPRTALFALALVCCVGSQDQMNGPPPRYPFPVAGALEADVIARYTGRTDTRLTIQRVGDDTELDCDAVMDDPHGALSAVSMGADQQWTLAPGDALPLWDRREAHERECYAIRLIRGGQTWLVAWRHGTPPMAIHDIRLDEGESAEPEAVRLPDEPGEPPVPPEGVRLVNLVATP